MEQKAGGGLQMRETMMDSDESWIRNFGKNYKKERAEAEEKRQEKARDDAAYWSKVKVDRKIFDAEFDRRAKDAWKVIDHFPKRDPISDAETERLFALSRKPSRGIEYSPASERIEMEPTGATGYRTTAPTYQPEKSHGIGKLHDRPAVF